MIIFKTLQFSCIRSFNLPTSVKGGHSTTSTKIIDVELTFWVEFFEVTETLMKPDLTTKS